MESGRGLAGSSASPWQLSLAKSLNRLTVGAVAGITVLSLSTDVSADFLRDLERRGRHGLRDAERIVRRGARDAERRGRHGLRDLEREWRSLTSRPAAIALAGEIRRARNEARRYCHPIPTDIYERMLVATNLPRRVLKKACYTTRGGGELSLGRLATHLGRAGAVTLDEVIVFRDRDATYDDALWAHELYHVDQYDRWGIDDFAHEYVMHLNKVENQAYSFEEHYAGRTPGIFYDDNAREYCDPLTDRYRCRDW